MKQREATMAAPNLPPLPETRHVQSKLLRVRVWRADQVKAYGTAAYQAGRDAGLEEAALKTSGWDGLDAVADVIRDLKCDEEGISNDELLSIGEQFGGSRAGLNGPGTGPFIITRKEFVKCASALLARYGIAAQQSDGIERANALWGEHVAAMSREYAIKDAQRTQAIAAVTFVHELTMGAYQPEEIEARSKAISRMAPLEAISSAAERDDAVLKAWKVIDEYAKSSNVMDMPLDEAIRAVIEGSKAGAARAGGE